MVDCVEQVTIVADASDHIDSLRSPARDGFVFVTFELPATPAQFSQCDHTFINIDDSILLMHVLYKLTCSILSLKSRVHSVSQCCDWP